MSIVELKTIIENDDAQGLTRILSHDKATVNAIFKALLDTPKPNNALGLALTHQAVDCMKILLATPNSETILNHVKYPTLLEAILDNGTTDRDILRLAIDNSVYHLDLFNRDIESTFWRYCLNHDLTFAIEHWLIHYPLSKISYNQLDDDDFSRIQILLERGIIDNDNLDDVEQLIEIWLSGYSKEASLRSIISQQIGIPEEKINETAMAEHLLKSGLENRIPHKWLLKMHIAGKVKLNKQTLSSMLHTILNFRQLEDEKEMFELLKKVLPTLTQNTQYDNKVLSYLLFFSVQTGDAQLLAEAIKTGRRIKSSYNLMQVALIALICTHSDLVQDMRNNHLSAEEKSFIFNIALSPKLDSDSLINMYTDMVGSRVTREQNTDYSEELLSVLTISNRIAFMGEHFSTKQIMKAVKAIKNPHLRIALTAYIVKNRGLEDVAKHFSLPIFRDWLKTHSITDVIAHLPAKLQREALNGIV